jgi:hypothetical protein
MCWRRLWKAFCSSFTLIGAAMMTSRLPVAEREQRQGRERRTAAC